jgi:hypothetical protein
MSSHRRRECGVSIFGESRRAICLSWKGDIRQLPRMAILEISIGLHGAADAPVFDAQFFPIRISIFYPILSLPTATLRNQIM